MLRAGFGAASRAKLAAVDGGATGPAGSLAAEHLQREGAVTPLVRLYVKTSFVFLIVGLVLGGYVTVQVNLVGRGVPWPLIAAHTHLILVGFVLMLVFGVATWMFPRPARSDGRYRPGLAWIAYWLLTASTVLRTLGEFTAAAGGGRGSSLAALGGLGQIAAAVVFVINMWTRVRMPGGVAPPAP